MIDGIANYTGEPAIEERCHLATAGIDAAIDDMGPVVAKAPRSRYERPATELPEYDRPGRAAAIDPEADAEFLRKVRERAEEQRRKAKEQAKEQATEPTEEPNAEPTEDETS